MHRALVPLLVVTLCAGCGNAGASASQTTTASGQDGAAPAPEAGAASDAGAAICGSGQPAIVARGQINAMGIAVDATSIYWTTASGADTGGGLWKMPVAGGTIEKLTSADAPTRLALDSSTVYAATGTANPKLIAVPKAGGASRVVATPTNQVHYLTVDATSLYWSDSSSINKVALAGGVPLLVASANLAFGVAVDSASLFWANGGDGTVMRMPLAGGTAVAIATGGRSPDGIVVDTTNAYWTDYLAGDVMKVGLGERPIVVASGQSHPQSLAIDETSIYWLNVGDGTVMKAAIAGGAACVLASGQHDFLSLAAYIAVDATSVYWTDPKAQTITRLNPK
jgi:hypothetical protein